MTYANDYTPEIGDRVFPAAGTCAARDGEHGRVLSIDGDTLTVAWDSGVRTHGVMAEHLDYVQ